MNNHYQILGLNRDASSQDIKIAYRKLALKYHPDKNQGDSFFEERFKAIQSAYDILSDFNEKNNYDVSYDNYLNNLNKFSEKEENEDENKNEQAKSEQSSNHENYNQTTSNYNIEEPIVFNKYLVSLTKIIAFYCFFFVLIKSIAIVRGAWILPNVMVTLPLIVMGILSAYTSYFQKYNWATAVSGAILVVAMRYFEADLVFYIHENW